jgi:hypothetical protein
VKKIIGIDKKARDAYVYFDKKKSIPELVYRFNRETCAIQVWPHLNFYYLEEDGTRTLRYSTPDLNLKELTLKEEIYFKNRISYLFWNQNKNSRLSQFWNQKRSTFREHFRKWMSYIPKELCEALQTWEQNSPFLGRSLYYASRSKHFYDLCISNPSLSYLLFQKDFWNPDHPFYERNLLDLVGEKQGVLCELLGLDKSHWKILRKIDPGDWEDEDLELSFPNFRDILKSAHLEKVFKEVKNIPKYSLKLILTSHRNNLIKRLEISLLNQLGMLIYRETQSKQLLSKEAKQRFVIEDLDNNRISLKFQDLITVWQECMEFNPNWRIKTINSLSYHENLMIKQLEKITEESESACPVYFAHPPIPYEGWNQGKLFGEDGKMTVVPIRDSYNLLIAGKKMKNCVYSYKSEMVDDEYFCYLLKFGNNREFMVGFEKNFLYEELYSACFEESQDLCWDEFFIPDLSVDSGGNQESVDEDCEVPVSGALWKVAEMKGFRNSDPPDYAMDELKKWLVWAREQSVILEGRRDRG